MHNQRLQSYTAGKLLQVKKNALTTLCNQVTFNYPLTAGDKFNKAVLLLFSWITKAVAGGAPSAAKVRALPRRPVSQPLIGGFDVVMRQDRRTQKIKVI